MAESINDELLAKISKTKAWLKTVTDGIASNTLTSSDLVCLQCEAEELLSLIIEKRVRMKAEREARHV